MSVLQFLHTVERLKTTKRTGWVRKYVDGPESISDHMYRMALLSMLTSDPSLNKEKMIKMCLVHDLAEAIVGDITPSDGISKQDKFKREEKAMQDMVHMLDKSPEILEIQSLWEEYEEGKSPEALFVKDLDKFEMIVQAFEYESRHATSESLQDFFDSTRDKFQHPIVKEWVQELYESRRNAANQSMKQADLPEKN